MQVADFRGGDAPASLKRELRDVVHPQKGHFRGGDASASLKLECFRQSTPILTLISGAATPRPH